jgi:hypothetical protein
MSDQWSFFDPDTSKKVIITTFDDGNEQYKYYTNTWHIIGRWRGKVALVNSENNDVKLSSISEWKVIALA